MSVAMSIRPRGRPIGSGGTSKLLKTLQVGDSIVLPPDVTAAALMQTARNRFYTPAKRLGIRLSFELEGGNVRVRRVE